MNIHNVFNLKNTFFHYPYIGRCILSTLSMNCFYNLILFQLIDRPTGLIMHRFRKHLLTEIKQLNLDPVVLVSEAQQNNSLQELSNQVISIHLNNTNKIQSKLMKKDLLPNSNNSVLTEHHSNICSSKRTGNVLLKLMNQLEIFPDF